MKKYKVLIIMPYMEIFPPKSGGMLRCFNLFLEYIKYYDVTAVMLQDSTSFSKALPDYPEVANARIYSAAGIAPEKDLFSFLPVRIANAVRYRWLVRSLKAQTDTSFLALYPALDKVLKREVFDAIILENLSLTMQYAYFRKMNPGAKIVYDSYNVDSALAKQAYEKGVETLENMNGVYKREILLYKRIDVLLCCSENDAADFNRLNKEQLKKVLIVPNGVDINKSPYGRSMESNSGKNILFCGRLDYEPNREGLLWFYRKIWPMVIEADPTLILKIVGRGSKFPFEEMVADPTVNFIGEVEGLAPYYHSSNISLAPLLQGSGTRLKILEAMSFGTPVVSTSIGAEGIMCKNRFDILIADSERAFADAVIELIMNKELADSISLKARELVKEKYCWEAIGEKLKEILP